MSYTHYIKFRIQKQPISNSTMKDTRKIESKVQGGKSIHMKNTVKVKNLLTHHHEDFKHFSAILDNSSLFNWFSKCFLLIVATTESSKWSQIFTTLLKSKYDEFHT